VRFSSLIVRVASASASPSATTGVAHARSRCQAASGSVTRNWIFACTSSASTGLAASRTWSASKIAGALATFSAVAVVTTAVPGPPSARAFATAAFACSGSIFWRKSSFCDAITSPVILSLPVENSFIGFALPDDMSRKLLSEMIRVQSAFCVSPSSTAPAPFFTSRVQALSGSVSLNRKVLPMVDTNSGLRSK